MADIARTQLIPLQELTPGAVGAIRNQVIKSLVAQASRELSLPPSALVVRDLRWVGDLAAYGSAAAAATVGDWTNACTASSGYTTIATGTMADQRYVGMFGIRDLRLGWNTHTTASAPLTTPYLFTNYASLVKFNIGGADKVIWDTKSLMSYPDNPVAFSPSAVVIPQNIIYTISYYKVVTSCGTYRIQLVGVAVEPRGKVISP